MLVSIIVATYNCAHYIVDTLDSVYNQTYRELELIVTDDCSKDDSVMVASRWIELHKNRFVNIVQTHTIKNSGVTANYNAGLHKARGEWIKCLDGDDMLPDDAIEKYVNKSSEHPEIKIWYANELPFDDDGNRGTLNQTILPIASPRKQMVYILNHRLLGICTATNFIHRETFVSQGGFDNRFPMYQDGSPFLQMLANKTSVGVINYVTLHKRENPDSLMHTANPIMVKNIRDCHYYYSRFYIRFGMPFHFYNVWVTHWISTHDTTRWQVTTIGYLLRCFDIINIYKKNVSIRCSHNV